ncbi:MAG: hypothetical protein RLY86_2470 [Pseudomonadota bacterium]|jgi:hypothetical protein
MTKPRVFISTDIGGSDKDDDQSLVHLLLYADKLQIEGLVSSPPPHGGRAKDILEVIDVYARDYPALSAKLGGFPSPSYLKSVTHQGSLNPQPAAGYSSSTAGSRAIVEAARDGSTADPLYILAWGPLTDVAQALRDAPDIVDKVRLISIGATNTTFDPAARNYIHKNMDAGEPFHKLWWIENNSTFRGMYVSGSGANDPGIHKAWIDANARGHGALGDYFVKMTTDLYGPGSVDGLKMGDTPSLLYLLDRVDNNNPGADSWGGDFVQNGRAPNYWTDSTAGADRLGSYNGAKTVYEHRNAYLSDFAARLDLVKAGGAAPSPSPSPSPDTSAPPVKPAPSPTPGPGAVIRPGLTEAEAMTLSGGYAREGNGDASGDSWIKVTGTGTAAARFDGAAGTYTLTSGFMNENDGASTVSVQVNGTRVGGWTGTGGTGAVEAKSVTLSLKPGDVVSLTGTQQGWEHARIDWLKLNPADGGAPAPSPAPGPSPAPAPAPSPAPSGGAKVQVGLTEAESLSLSGGYARETHTAASGGSWLKATGTGTAAGSFNGPSGGYSLSLRYLDENDGQSTFTVLVNGSKVGGWTTSAAATTTTTTRSLPVTLKTGDVIAVSGRQDGGEHARLDWIRLDPTGAAPVTSNPTPTPAPGGGLAKADFDAFAFAGQSNAAGHFYRRGGDASGSGLGNDIFERALGAELGGSVSAINAATSGSASNERVDSGNYWWNLGQNKPGPALLDAVSRIKAGLAGGKDLDGLIWAQGEDEAQAIRDDFSNASRVLADMTTATTKVFAHLRGQFGRDLPIFIQELGEFPQDGAWLDGPVGALDRVRAAQQKIIDADPLVFLGADTAGRRHLDGIHFTNDAYGRIATDLADTVALTLVGIADGGF